MPKASPGGRGEAKRSTALKPDIGFGGGLRCAQAGTTPEQPGRLRLAVRSTRQGCEDEAARPSNPALSSNLDQLRLKIPSLMHAVPPNLGWHSTCCNELQPIDANSTQPCWGLVAALRCTLFCTEYRSLICSSCPSLPKTLFLLRRRERTCLICSMKSNAGRRK